MTRLPFSEDRDQPIVIAAAALGDYRRIPGAIDAPGIVEALSATCEIATHFDLDLSATVRFAIAATMLCCSSNPVIKTMVSRWVGQEVADAYRASLDLPVDEVYSGELSPELISETFVQILDELAAGIGEVTR